MKSEKERLAERKGRKCEMQEVMIKKIALGALMIFLIICLSACSGATEKTTLTDEKGKMLRLSINEIEESGFYVYDKESKTFTPVMGGFEEGGGFIKTKDETKYIRAGSARADLYNLIPVVDRKKSFLVMFQADESKMPDEYVLEKYKYMGHSLGASFTRADTGSSLYMDTGDICESSSAKEILKPYSSNLLKVSKINDNKDLPLDNVDNDINVLLGLEKSKKYKVSFYDGTKFSEVDLTADTAVFKYKEKVKLQSPLRATEQGFFYIKLPKNLKNGYYAVNELGLIKFTGQIERKDNRRKEENTLSSDEYDISYSDFDED